MKSITQQAAPNIISGVNFNADRFEELFAWMSAIAADSVQAILLPHQYGLVVPFDGKSALEMRLVNQKIVVNRCSGITAKGSVIGVFEDITPVLEAALPNNLQKETEYVVVISVNPMKRLAFGATAADAPERPKFSMPKYNIGFRKPEELTNNPSNMLPIGLLKMEGETVELIEYMPPCVHLGATKLLREKYLEYQGELQHLLNYLPKVIQQTGSYEDRTTMALREFCMQTGSYLSQQSAAYFNLGKHGSPYSMIKTWCEFAGVASFVLQCFREDARREFYRLLNHNTHGGARFNSNEFKRILDELSVFQFKQNDLLAATEKVDELLKMMVPIFRMLSTNFTRPSGTSWSENSKPEPKKIVEVAPEKPVAPKKKSSPFSW